MITKQEKQYIVEQRAIGRTFGQIGQALGKTEGAVRNTFYRIMSGYSEDVKSDGSCVADLDQNTKSMTECKYCGKPLVKVPKGGKRQFCSPQCRDAWWNEKKRKTPYILRCENCGRRYTVYGNSHRKFCSRKCALESRKNAKQEVPGMVVLRE